MLKTGAATALFLYVGFVEGATPEQLNEILNQLTDRYEHKEPIFDKDLEKRGSPDAYFLRTNWNVAEEYTESNHYIRHKHV